MTRQFDILVLGELNVDLILTGDDVTPVFGQAEKLVDDAELALGSSSAIFACGASRLGLKVAFLGKIGDDDFGRFVLRTLQSRGVDTSPVIVDPSIKTGLTLHLSRRGDRAMLTYLGSIAALRGDEVDPRIFKNTRHVHTGSYFLQKGLQPELARLFHEAHSTHTTTSLDPGWDPQEKWNGFLPGILAETDVFLPNEQEALAISRSQDLDSAISHLSKQIPVVAVKMGADGARAIQAASQAQVKGFYVPSIDTTGAGDSFDSGFLYGYLKGLSLQDSLSWGCACGALNTTRVGGIAGQPTIAEVKEFLSGQL